MAVRVYVTRAAYFTVSEFIVETIGNVACFLRKSFDLLGEIEENDNRN